jgi:hypothetical protein
MTHIRVFLDTMMLVYAADERLRLAPRRKRIQWGGVDQDIIVHQPIVERPNNAFDAALKAEVESLPFVAFMAYRDRLELLCQAEAIMEQWGAPASGDTRGLFYGAPVTHVPGPIEYGRVVLSGFPEPLPPVATTKPMSQTRHRQIAFMAGLTHPRFVQLRRACGADKAKGIDPSQLADAFHLWSAEVAGATYFLTAERKLLALGSDSALGLTCRPVSPSQLVNAVCPSRVRQLYFRALLRLDEWLHPQRWHVAV